MARTLKEFLLGTWNGTSRRLFTSQREIARMIAARPGSRYAGKEDSLAVFINQVIGHSRPCPTALCDEILSVASEAAARHAIDEKQVDRELRAILFGAPTTKPLTVSDLLLRQMDATEVVVVSAGTVEDRGHPRQDEFIDVTISKLMENPEARYTFFIDQASNRAAIKQEEGLLYGVQRFLKDCDDKKKQATGAEGILKDLFDRKRVRIEKLDSDLLIIPVVAFEPSDSDLHADVYVWDWTEGNPVEDYVAKMSPMTKKRWLELFFTKHLRPILTKDSQRGAK